MGEDQLQALIDLLHERFDPTILVQVRRSYCVLVTLGARTVHMNLEDDEEPGVWCRKIIRRMCRDQDE